MAVKTRRHTRTEANDSDTREQNHELPPASTRFVGKMPTSIESHQQPVSPGVGKNLILDLPPEIRNSIYEYCVIMPDPVALVGRKTSHTPDLLRVNRRIREEAFPIFYSNNEFGLETCSAIDLTRWLFRAVQPKHLKFINAISWSSTIGWACSGGCGDAANIYSRRVQNTTSIHLSSVIMLLELGLLGSCKVKMMLNYEPRLHVACTLRQLIKKVIARKGLTEADTWNEDGAPGMDDVAGLSYAVSKEWGKTLPQVFQNYQVLSPPLADEMYCTSCQSIDTSRHCVLPWVSRDMDAGTESDGQEYSPRVEANLR
jgi:hypothetical protein